MWNFIVRGLVHRRVHTHAGTQRRRIVLCLCALLLFGGLTACGAVSSGKVTAAAPTTTPLPTPTVTVAPTPVPTATPTLPPNPPISATAILNVQPSSMSIVGPADCKQGATYMCTAEVLALSSNQGSLRWFASTTVPGHVVFSPSSGVLAPGQHVVVSISVPLGDCTPGLFIFRGPANTHTISWAC
jgi:hypothetical protein